MFGMLQSGMKTDPYHYETSQLALGNLEELIRTLQLNGGVGLGEGDIKIGMVLDFIVSNQEQYSQAGMNVEECY